MEAGDFVKGDENPDDFVRFHIFLVGLGMQPLLSFAVHGRFMNSVVRCK